ncbi:MAG TPA: hypothetical protein DCK93_12395, partial [Blastocatellia bacterium]|nr:hypothetical protein [Blastocatellia bacterium]
MKITKKLIVSAIVTLSMASSIGVLAQTQTDAQKTRQRTAAMPNQVKDKTKKVGQDPTTNPQSGDRLEPDDTGRRPSDVPQETEANRHEQLSEEAA